MKQFHIVARLTGLLNFLMAISIQVFSQASLPKVVPPSPEATALFRFQDYPMDYSTGLPQISIPIYEVKSGSLSVPISISYHASGRRVMDEDGPISLGWSLNAGGIISRTIYGNADFGTPNLGTYLFPYLFNTTGLTNANDITYLGKIMHYDNSDANLLPWTESEYDVFSYSFGDNGGKFIFKDNNNVKTPVLLPYKPYVITPYYTSRGLTGIDIMDDKGTLYKFTSVESAGPDADYAVTSLSLSQIISADKTDTITFIYTGFAKWTKSFSQTRTYIDQYSFANEQENGTYPPEGNIGTTTDNESTSQGVYQLQRLTEIDFKQGKLIFNLVSGNDKIDNIQLKDLNNTVLKTIQFNRSALDGLNQGGSSLISGASQLNNKLDAVLFKDASGNTVENYSFEYFPTKYYLSQTKINVHHIDWWGYYNCSGFDNMVPSYTFADGTSVGSPSYNREPDLEAMKSGVLKKIIYPTGGNTTFTYEINRYFNLSTGTVKPGPGLRISQLTNSDLNGNTSVKSYKYGVSEIGYGFLDMRPDITTMADHITYPFYFVNNFNPLREGSYGKYIFYSGFIPSLSALSSRPVIYTEVTEYNGTPTENSGKTVYTYDNYAWAPAGITMDPSHPKMHVYSCNYWNNPSLLTKTDYKRVQASGGVATMYTPRQKVANFYTINNLDDVAGLHVLRALSLTQAGVDYVHFLDIERYAAKYESANIYAFSDYHIPVGIKNLTSSTITNYFDDGSSISNTTAYQYNNYQYQSRITQPGSDGRDIITDIKYPFDYTGNSLLAQMGTLNMYAYPIEQTTSKSDGTTTTPVTSTRTNYLNWGTTPARIAPETVDIKTGNGNYETRLRYSAYDADGNPLMVSKEGDQPISYIWGYNNTYPIAEVMNAPVKNIFHTSFEDGSGNSTLNDCKTGRMSKTDGYSKSLTNLDNGSYILSYWQKSGSAWTLQSSTVTVSAGSYNISLTGQVDEVRFYPKTAQMKTYAYDALIGVISQCDVSDHVIYYEYDDYSRLKLIRDMNGNIVKTFNYKYQSPTAN